MQEHVVHAQHFIHQSMCEGMTHVQTILYVFIYIFCSWVIILYVLCLDAADLADMSTAYRQWGKCLKLCGSASACV